MSRFNPEISLGSILSIGTMIVGLTIFAQTVAADVRINTKAIAALDERLTHTENKVDTTLTTLATERVALTETLTELRTDLRYLRQAVDRLQEARK